MGFLKQVGKFKLLASFILIIAMFAAVFYLVDRLGLFVTEPVSAAEVNITAEQEDKQGMDIQSAFLLTSSAPLDERAIRAALQIVPAFEYKVESGRDKNAYRIVPAEKLSANTVYSLAFAQDGQVSDKLSWAFQTKGSFRVVSSLPGPNATGVPMDTGIEVQFSHEGFDLNKAADFFTIEPQVKGRFEQHKKVLVFVPEKLQLSTLYTVTVKKGFPLLGSDVALPEDYVFSFETVVVEEEGGQFNFDTHTRLNEFAAGEAPVFQAYFNTQYHLDKRWGKDRPIPPLTVTVYSYPGYREFAEDLALRAAIPDWTYRARQYLSDVSKLTKAYEYNMEFFSTDDYTHYIALPEALPAGYYAVRLQAEACIRQVWLQVTDLSTYLALGEEQGLIWVNDLKTKKPVSGAAVEIIGQSVTAKTNADGVAQFDFGFKTEDMKQTAAYARVSARDKETVVPLEQLNQQYYTSADYTLQRDHWKYLYLERELFQPGDDLHYWGIMAPRGKGVQKINELTVELKSGGGMYYRGDNAPILSQKVRVENNTFTGSIKLPVLYPDYYYLQVKYGETVLTSRGFEVETYQKPAYQLTLSTDKRAVFVGEGMNVETQATFFEGTPVPKLGLNYFILGSSGTVTTGEKGTAKVPYIARTGEDYAFMPYFAQYMRVSATLPEAGEIYATKNIFVFNSKVHIKGEAVRQGEEVTLQADLSRIDLTKINQGADFDEKNYLSGPAANVPVQGKVYQEVWEKRDAGEYYDFISKKVIPSYYYEYSERHISDFSMISDENGKSAYTLSLSADNSYFIVLTAEDSEGRRIKNRVHVPGATSPRGYNYYSYYYLKDVTPGKSYLPGETVQLTMMDNEEAVAPKEKSFLYLRGQKKVESVEVKNNGEYSFNFREEDIPNVNVYAVYFDGTAYQETGRYAVAFDQKSKELQVKIETDKAEYRPGETVALSVEVKDKNNKPVQAEVNLNLVDEAIYSMAEQQVDLLNRLYNDQIYFYLNTRKSHYHPGFGGGAEMGGEGGGERRDFRDTVLFASVHTDSKGTARTEFKLPDNLTSWRVTYHAVNDSLEVAGGTTQIPVRLPFFVDLVFNDVYLAGDAPVVVARSYGTALGSQDRVNFQMRIDRADQEKFLVDNQEVGANAQALAFTAADWPVPPLPVGEYILRVAGKSGEYEDSLAKAFVVKESLLERTVTAHDLLEESFSLPAGVREPFTLMFSDYEKSQYLRGLYQLAWRGGSRVEQQLAAQLAQGLLKEYFPEEALYFGAESGEQGNVLQYQQQDGGISILPYAESDPYLSALIASAASEKFDKTALAGYFYRLLDEEENVDRSVALWGLSALRQPVLLEVRTMLEQTGLSPAQKINLALALFDIGNGAAGEKVFAELLQAYGEDLQSTMRINVGADQDDIITATTQMALLAARLDAPAKHKLYQYLLENRGTDILNLVEQTLILKYNLLKMNPEPVSFAYELKGEKHMQTLEGRKVFRLTVLPEDAAALKFSLISGKVGVVTAYHAPYTAADVPPRDDLKITREYRVNKKTVTTLGRADLVEVTINYTIGEKAPAGSYEIVDTLPAGLRYVARPYSRYEKPAKHLTWPTGVKGQSITFAAYKDGNPIVYYARVTSPGEFKAEPILLSHVRSNEISVLGSGGRVVINR
ncbi:MAG: Ig-like domain-containing protein [Clostridia bacterium]|jgi:hypothetical protein|nr:Ig-like domain-containing protein [Clostridia bacterium]